MKLRPFAVTVVLMLASQAASAETLLVQRVKERPAAVPARGLSMAEVESRLGAAQHKLDPRGGQKRQWPTIDRWVYPQFTVYFERQKVIDVVANQAHADEIGPKPL